MHQTFRRRFEIEFHAMNFSTLEIKQNRIGIYRENMVDLDKIRYNFPMKIHLLTKVGAAWHYHHDS